MQVSDVFSRICPLCKVGRLSYLKHYKQGSDPRVKFYQRSCDSCGARFLDTVERRRELLAPGSALPQSVALAEVAAPIQ